MVTTDFSGNDKPKTAAASTDSYSEMSSLKMELLHQSLKRGLSDLNRGEVQDGDFVFALMIDVED